MTAVTDSDAVRSVIAAELALFTRLVDVPVAPLGYGTDISCTSDLSARMDEVDPFSVVGLSEAIVRRLDCPRGALPDDADYGMDLRGMLNRGTTADEIRSLAGRIRSEIQKDDRIESAAVTVTPSSTGSSLRVSLVITPVDARLGGFRLVVAVTDAALLLEEMSRT
jgi:hypothetical protein